MTVSLLLDPFATIWDSAGANFADTVTFYEAGTSTLKTIYSDQAGLVPEQNPYPLVAGRPTVYGTDGEGYKMVLKDILGNTLKTLDNHFSQRTLDFSGLSANSIADLRLVTGSFNNEIKHLLGYSLPGDGGEGPFYWNSTSIAVDDDWEFVKPVSISGAGRWIRLNNELQREVLALTNSGGDFVHSTRYGELKGNDVYDPIFPSITHFDTNQNVVRIIDTGNIEHAAAVSGYIQSEEKDVNGVCLFGCGLSTVDDVAIWGLNTLLQDQATRVAGTSTGRKLIGELDYNVMNPGTEVIGLSIGGNSLAQPAVANGFLCNVLGNGNKWVTGFFALDGACSNAFVAGMSELSGNNVPSSKILLQSSDGTATKQTATIEAQAGAFVVLSGMALKLASQSLLLDTGQSIIINGNSVLGDRATGWTTATGTGTRTSFATGSVTLPQLAERVKALIDDFIAHGAIGT